MATGADRSVASDTERTTQLATAPVDRLALLLVRAEAFANDLEQDEEAGRSGRDAASDQEAIDNALATDFGRRRSLRLL